MKKIILALIVSIFAITTSVAQEISLVDTSKYVYCQLVGTEKFLSNKVTIQIDFGAERNYWKDARLRDEQTGKVRLFNSMVDALNYMGDDGWEFIQAYVITVSSQNVYHWLLKKKVPKKGA